VADSSGFYSLRHLPVGTYDVRAYDDQNANRRRDLLEPVDSGHTAAFVAPADTVALVFHVLSADSSAPRVTRAAAVDSLHVGIELDDPVEADATSLAAARAEVHLLPDSTRYAGAVRIMAGVVFAAELAAAADSAPATPVPPPSLPVRELVVRLDRTLAPGTYTITLSGITNLHGLTGGGIERFDVTPPPPPPPPPPDTTMRGTRR
jgi:hypothetical protein